MAADKRLLITASASESVKALLALAESEIGFTFVQPAPAGTAASAALPAVQLAPPSVQLTGRGSIALDPRPPLGPPPPSALVDPAHPTIIRTDGQRAIRLAGESPMADGRRLNGDSGLLQFKELKIDAKELDWLGSKNPELTGDKQWEKPEVAYRYRYRLATAKDLNARNANAKSDAAAPPDKTVGGVVVLGCDKRTVRVKKYPFTKGQYRMCFYLNDITDPPELGGAKLVAKESLLADANSHSLESVLPEIETHLTAQAAADNFNRDMREEGKTVQFVPIYVYVFPERPEHRRTFLVETYMSREFVKYTNNKDWINSAVYSNTLMAYIHYTWERFSKESFVVVDLQGARLEGGYFLTDPQIHCVNDSPEFIVAGNGRWPGVHLTFSVHRCNHICRRLRLTPVSAESRESKRSQSVEAQAEGQTRPASEFKIKSQFLCARCHRVPETKYRSSKQRDWCRGCYDRHFPASSTAAPSPAAATASASSQAGKPATAGTVASAPATGSAATQPKSATPTAAAAAGNGGAPTSAATPNPATNSAARQPSTRRKSRNADQRKRSRTPKPNGPRDGTAGGDPDADADDDDGCCVVS